MFYYTAHTKLSAVSALEKPKEANWILPVYWIHPRVLN
jgi:hypothetical protein